MSNKVKPKAAAAKRGCLSARHWQDVRQAVRLARSEGMTLIVHGVTVTPDRGHQPRPEGAQLLTRTTTTALDGRGQQLAEAASNACEHPSTKQHERQQAAKDQRKERSLRRLHEYQQTKACGARWMSLVWGIQRRNRAKSRDDVWTEHMRYKIAISDKARAFLGRALQLFRSQAAAVRDRSALSPPKSITALVDALRCADTPHTIREALLQAMPLREEDAVGNEMRAAQDRLRTPQPEDNSWSPPKRRPLRSIGSNTPSPDDRRGAKRASKKPKGSRARRR